MVTLFDSSITISLALMVQLSSAYFLKMPETYSIIALFVLGWPLIGCVSDTYLVQLVRRVVACVRDVASLRRLLQVGSVLLCIYIVY